MVFVKYICACVYQWTFGVATLHRFGQERFAVAVELTAHGYARIERRPLAANRVDRTVENATLLLVTRATLSVFRVSYDYVVGANGRGSALNFDASAARRRLVAVTRTTRPVFPAIVHLWKPEIFVQNTYTNAFNLLYFSLRIFIIMIPSSYR